MVGVMLCPTYTYMQHLIPRDVTEGGFVPKDACTGHVMRARARERERDIGDCTCEKVIPRKVGAKLARRDLGNIRQSRLPALCGMIILQRLLSVQYFA